MLQQNSYVGHYAEKGVTSTSLRNDACTFLALADLLDHPALPMDPLNILAYEKIGFVVNLETGAITHAVTGQPYVPPVEGATHDA